MMTTTNEACPYSEETHTPGYVPAGYTTAVHTCTICGENSPVATVVTPMATAGAYAAVTAYAAAGAGPGSGSGSPGSGSGSSAEAGSGSSAPGSGSNGSGSGSSTEASAAVAAAPARASPTAASPHPAHRMPPIRQQRHSTPPTSPSAGSGMGSPSNRILPQSPSRPTAPPEATDSMSSAHYFWDRWSCRWSGLAVVRNERETRWGIFWFWLGGGREPSFTVIQLFGFALYNLSLHPVFSYISSPGNLIYWNGKKTSSKTVYSGPRCPMCMMSILCSRLRRSP